MKRHGSKQIITKLRQADELAAEGLTQAEFCKALGISVMTYHRWRKLALTKSVEAPPPPQPRPAGRKASVDSEQSDHEYLLEENRQLRKIITDLLLEKTRLEELLNNSPARSKRNS